jgi:pimeloyl-ACP methyl ester carboxylesterase
MDVKQIVAGDLNVGYVDAGPEDGAAVLLLHGWPYDIHSYADVAPLLAAKGYRVIIPYLRGYGTTHFLSEETFRNGEQAALALDVIALLDALQIESPILAGFDWGARTADVVAALWPERCKGLVSVSGYLIGSQDAGRLPLPPAAELQWWYQYYFATDRGRAGYDKYRRDFAKLIWRIASPKWDFDDATFDRSAASFENPDHVDIVIHNYRWRLGLAKGRVGIRRAGRSARRSSGHRRARDHPRGRRERCTPSGPECLRQEIRGQVFTPDDRGRHWAQPSSGSSGSLCQSCYRRRRLLMKELSCQRQPATLCRSPWLSSTAPSPTPRAGTAS